MTDLRDRYLQPASFPLNCFTLFEAAWLQPAQTESVFSGLRQDTHGVTQSHTCDTRPCLRGHNQASIMLFSQHGQTNVSRNQRARHFLSDGTGVISLVSCVSTQIIPRLCRAGQSGPSPRPLCLHTPPERSVQGRRSKGGKKEKPEPKSETVRHQKLC